MGVNKVIVVGAGPAGLATAAQLRRAKMPAIVLEQADVLAAAWRGRYDRLKLNSPRWYSTLPGGPGYPRGTGVFPARDDVVRYLDAYAAHHKIDIRFGVTVQRIERDGARWRVFFDEVALRGAQGPAAQGAAGRALRFPPLPSINV